MGRGTTIAFALIAFVAASAAGSAATADGRPNEVLVIADDQGCGDLNCHGNPLLRARDLDRPHEELVRLADYHPVPCSPTGAALMTGHRTNRTAVWHASGGPLLAAGERGHDGPSQPFKEGWCRTSALTGRGAQMTA